MPDPLPATSAIRTTDDPPVSWWLWPQVLSLDAPIVIVLWQAALAHTHRVHLPPAFAWGLALVTWLVYVVDRTADAVSGRLARPPSARHAFYYKHRKATLFAVLPAGFLAMIWVALNEMPSDLLWRGLGLALLGAIYLAYFSARRASRLYLVLMLVATLIGLVMIVDMPAPASYRWFLAAALVSVVLFAIHGRFDARWRALLPKEVFAALLIALGCAAGVHFWVPEDHNFFCIEVALICGLFLVNLLGIASSEHLAELHADPESLLQTRPSLASGHLWLVGGMIAASVWVAFTSIEEHQAPGVVATAVTVALATALHGVLHLFVRRLRPELYHLLADAVLIIPLPVLFWLMPN